MQVVAISRLLSDLYSVHELPSFSSLGTGVSPLLCVAGKASHLKTEEKN